MRKGYLDTISLEELSGLVADSDQHAFNVLFDLLWDPMFAYAASLVLDSSIAKDLVQEVWIDYWQRREEVDIHNIKAYLYKAIRYRSYNALRNMKFNITQIEAANAVFIPSEVELEEDVIAMNNRIENVLATLPERCQEIFRLSRINQLSNREIALKLNISQRSVENQISLALRKLRREIPTAILCLL
ncbi:sigma-70 family RNA polymerase sigma factor [Robertkochia solimangrovi]|uniref:sigma-70 family RNA polymerase sigma factor n=1 Tax=Robertkochia solimangrovi TaxID=2213046 RepID=UPI00117D60E8|nr:sigma-70 family RNA polymerase sigma factor [Robertkochia solimangrovi]TRZ44347.1 RNA polymerase sigma-70 factor [Robertkochia solimangrovi]